MSATGPGLAIRRLAAATTAVALIVGAWLVRTRVIDGDGGSSDSGRSDRVLDVACVNELAGPCQSVFAGTGVSLVVRDADETLTALADSGDTDAPLVWITFDGLPAAADRLRAAVGRPALDLETQRLVQSPVVAVARTAPVGDCATDVWRCDATIGFARPPDSATRWLTTVVALDRGLDGGIAAATSSLGRVQAEQVLTRLPESRLSSPSAVATLCNRPTFDYAAGIAAELDRCASADDLAVTYRDDMVTAVVVVAGTALDSNTVDRLRDELVAAGWDAVVSGRGPDADLLLLARSVWSEL